MGVLLEGETSPALIAAFLVALNAKGETAEELAGFARAMRDRAVFVNAGKNLIDVRNEILTAIRDATKDAGSSDFDHPDKAADLDWSKLRKSIGELIEKACNRN